MTADAVGGVFTYALDLSRGLAARGVRTTLAVVGPPPSAAQAAEARAISGLTLVHTGLELDWTAGASATVEAAGPRLAELAERSGADLVQVNSAALAAHGDFPCPVVVAAHSCMGTWWRAVRGGPMPADFVWRTALAGRGYERAEAVVAPSQAFAEATARQHGLDRAPVVVRNGRTAARARRRPEPAAFAFTAGRLWDAGKNLEVLDAAAARIRAPVIAAGPVQGPHGGRLPLARLVMAGDLSAAEVQRILARRPVFVSTALYEPFGLAVLEAAQSGCALVLSDIPTLRELWDGAALFVDPRDPGAVTEALNAVLHGPELRATLAAAATARARRYTVERMAGGMLGVYRGLVPGAALADADPETPSRGLAVA
jgi:glycosyltransferase involved in cell wall biosynthesis